MNIGFIQKRKYANGKKEDGLSKLCSTALALALNSTLLTPKIKPKKDKYPILINWGVSDIPWLLNRAPLAAVLNHPNFIRVAINKISAFHIFEANEVSVPKFTTSKAKAASWFDVNEKAMVFCRTLPSSFQGKGIVIAKSKEELVDAPLYTLRFPKKWEYRIHVVNSQPIFVQQKKKLSKEKLKERGIEDNDGLIRSYNNGYTYSSNINLSQSNPIFIEMCNQAVKAVDSLRLFFGAVDVIVSKSGKIAVLEVNTAPGIEGKTIETYVEAFNKYINS